MRKEERGLQGEAWREEGGLEDRKRILQATKALGGGSSKQTGFAGRKNVLESTREDGFVSLPWGL